MTPVQLISIATARYGKNWKLPIAQETGWSYFTFVRAASGKIEISAKLEKAVLDLKKKPRKEPRP